MPHGEVSSLKGGNPLPTRRRAGSSTKPTGALSWLWASCERVSSAESEARDQDRFFWERLMVRAHQLSCPACRRFRIQVRMLGALVERLKARPETGDRLPGLFLPIDDRERIKTALRRANDPSGLVPPRGPRD